MPLGHWAFLPPLRATPFNSLGGKKFAASAHGRKWHRADRLRRRYSSSDAEGPTEILRLSELPHGSNTSRLRSVLDANALAEYTMPSDPTIDATAVIANL